MPDDDRLERIHDELVLERLDFPATCATKTGCKDPAALIMRLQHSDAGLCEAIPLCAIHAGYVRAWILRALAVPNHRLACAPHRAPVTVGWDPA